MPLNALNVLMLLNLFFDTRSICGFFPYIDFFPWEEIGLYFETLREIKMH